MRSILFAFAILETKLVALIAIIVLLLTALIIRLLIGQQILRDTESLRRQLDEHGQHDRQHLGAYLVRTQLLYEIVLNQQIELLQHRYQAG
uniref:Putative secreted peptide n=1 Tax=Anopheles braziliensis TaxID=58242 RepID=A0A2M3ZRC8_9DIPT